EKETPDNTARNAFKKLICCIGLTDIFHLIASMDQLAIINTTTAIRFHTNEVLNEDFIPCHAVSRLGCFTI
ncbi:MAG: hypothetical protein WAT14_07655, partial [Chitinophagaceae bacterium]